MFNRTKSKGMVSLILTNVKTGKVHRMQRHNLVTNNGEQWIARRMVKTGISGHVATGMEWIEVGKGSAAATATNTNLQTTINVTGVRRVYTTQDRSGATWNIIVNYGTSHANTSGLKEAGIFSTSTRASVAAPGMLARTVFSAVNKTNADTLKIQWQINVADDGV